MLIPGLEINHEGQLPVYRQIADGVRAAALAGHLTAGHRLPPTRDLARQLGVNRQTVVAAYDYLASKGWVTSHTGKGTFLASPVGPSATRAAANVQDPDEGWLPAFSRTVEGSKVGGLLSIYQTAIASGGISFAGSYPARELLPVDAFAEAMAGTLSDDGARHLIYGPTAGHSPLRECLDIPVDT